jgi:alginate O-acetyltransferase complex protein AlgI
MVLGGLWHGANWTFVVWGSLHGVFLVMNHGYRAWCGEERLARLAVHRLYVVIAWGLTLLFVVVAWVFFRSNTLTGAARMLKAMFGAYPLDHSHPLLWNAGLHVATGWWWCAVLGLLAVVPINSNRIGEKLLLTVRVDAGRRALLGGVAVASVLALVLVNMTRASTSAFIYFNF